MLSAQLAINPACHPALSACVLVPLGRGDHTGLANVDFPSPVEAILPRRASLNIASSSSRPPRPLEGSVGPPVRTLHLCGQHRTTSLWATSHHLVVANITAHNHDQSAIAPQHWDNASCTTPTWPACNHHINVVSMPHPRSQYVFAPCVPLVFHSSQPRAASHLHPHTTT